MKNTKRLNKILTNEFKILDCIIYYDAKIKKYKVVHFYAPENQGTFFHNFFIGNHKDCENFIRGFFAFENLEKLKKHYNDYDNFGCDSNITRCPKNPQYGY